MTKQRLLGDIPASQWDKIKIVSGLADQEGLQQGEFVSQEVFNSIASKMGDTKVEYIDKETELEGLENLSLEETKPKGEVRNILLIGKTGNGKSTLGNVLVNKGGKFEEEIFRESAGSVSATKGISEETFEVAVDKENTKKITYRVIDTIGLGDTTLTTQGVLARLAEVAERVKAEGLNRILFIAKGRFTKEEVEAYELLRKVIFDEVVVSRTTIVRTAFPDFSDKEACEDDRLRLKEENLDLANILMEVDIIYVDNPPLKGRPKAIEANKEIREDSREKLINYLMCKPGTYRPRNIDTLNQRVNDYKTDNEKLQEEMKKAEKEREKVAKEFRDAIKEYEKNQAQARKDYEKLQKDFEKKQKEAEERSKKSLKEMEKRNEKERKEAEERSKKALKEMTERNEKERKEMKKMDEEKLKKVYEEKYIQEAKTLLSEGKSLYETIMLKNNQK